MNKYFSSMIIMIICFITVYCEKSPTGYISYDDIEIDIINISTRTFGDQNANRATIEFTVENTGTRTIEYWQIIFNLHFTDSPTVEFINKYRVIIQSGEISDRLSATKDIPKFKEPTGAIMTSFKIND